ncbi:hypothetical protein DDZ18_09460 [Marinicauda salina]|uniref:Uncharacterized protein n=1 Tax=Marinicauda salina TaxID=2135793 RepID=A0A2U2BSE7_9PROT|nr:hypothetical protein [Marinicauda salina]PWE16929.1 hypothetical protein DDZ18_09460 [Marinicauda salina]
MKLGVIAFLAALLFAAPASAQAEIDWTAARRDQTTAVAWPVNRDRAALDSVRLPVLLPAASAGATVPGRGDPGVLFFARGDSYVASCEMSGISIEIAGMSRGRFAVPGSAPDVTRNATGMEANFSRYGAGYTVTVACSDPRARRECTDAGFIRGVINSLRVAGGSPG